MRAKLAFALVIAWTSLAEAQAWKGIIDDKRATDWTLAGVAGGLPDASWTPCGASIDAYDGAPDKINTALAACGANQYVALGAGTFHLSGSIDFAHKDHVVLRGAGASKTKLVFSAASKVDCNLGNETLIAICSKDKTDLYSSPPVYDWTGGLAQGSTTLTLSGNASIVTGSMLFLSQNDDGYSGYPASGAATDNGGYFVCADKYQTGPTTGCSYDGPDGTYPSPFTHRWQYEVVVVTNVAGNDVTVTPPIRHPNWRSGQHPTAMVQQPVVGSGVEDLSIDVGNDQNIGYGIDIWACDGCWVSGVEVKNFYNWGIGLNWSVHGQIQDSYVFDGAGTGPDSYGMRLSTTASSLVVNNIFHHIRASLVFDEPDCGSVVAYNYSVAQWYASDAMFAAFWPHSAGDDFQLYEGNVSNGIVMDDSHGSHLSETIFRNFSTGWESCANGLCGTEPTKDFGATPNPWPYGMRFGNLLGNVSGTPGFHKQYQSTAFGGCDGSGCAIYALGESNGGATPNIPADPLVPSTMLRWGNWDTVSNDVHFDAAEVPTAAGAYPNSVPANQTLPASLLYTQKPAWFGNVPFPPIGPDVQNGSVGMCSGALNTKGQFAGTAVTKDSQCTGASMTAAWGGHVNAIPAMACYFALGGLPDGTGGELAFDAKACYSSGGVTTDGGLADAGGSDGDGGTTGGSNGGCGCTAAPLHEVGGWSIGLGAVWLWIARRKKR